MVVAGVGERVADWDLAIDARLSGHRHGRVDDLAHLLASSADRSKIWMVLAALRAAVDRRDGSRAAVRALCVVAAESAVVHSLVKPLFRRGRPDSELELRFGARRPPSSSFPSGHAASATTAAILLADGQRGWGAPLGLIAAGICWSRVQTGLHHGSDVAGGMLIGTGVGLCVKRVIPLHSERAND
ncbi:MAG: phosphatase PAP2 family protein [Candidatus Dormibacteria bacterium]